MIRLREISVQLYIDANVISNINRECFFRTLIERIKRILQMRGTCFPKDYIYVRKTTAYHTTN